MPSLTLLQRSDFRYNPSLSGHIYVVTTIQADELHPTSCVFHSWPTLDVIKVQAKKGDGAAGLMTQANWEGLNSRYSTNRLQTIRYAQNEICFLEAGTGKTIGRNMVRESALLLAVAAS